MINSNELYNDEAERIILGIAIVAPDKVLSISVMLEIEDFFDRRHQLIIKAIKELIDDNKDVDIVSVSELLKFNKQLTMAGGREYITSLAMDVITTNNYKHYCKIILKYSKKRKLLNLINGTEKALFDANDIDEVLLSLKGDINSLIANTTSSDIPTLFTGVTDVMDKVNTILTSEDKTFGLSTGFKTLDLMLSGLCPNKIYVLGARPAMGKSAIAQQIGEYIAQKHNVLYVSLEMGVEEFTERSLLSKCGLTKEMLSRNLVNIDEAMDKLAVASEDISKLKLYILDKPRCTIDKIEQAILDCKQNKGSCDLVIVDYLQLMKGTDKRIFDMKDIVSQLSNNFKILAREYKIPVILLSQLSRNLESRMDKRPILADLRESGAIEQDADVVLFLYRQEVYTQNPRDRGRAELIIAKNRDGRIGMIPFIFDNNRVKFSEVKNEHT